MDTGNIADVTGQYWEYFVSGQTLKDYLRIPKNGDVTPFGWFRKSEYEKQVLRQFRMQQKSGLVDHRVELYICAACGYIGCGSITAKVQDLGDRIIWCDFASTSDAEEIGELFDVEPIEFDRVNYFKAFAQIL